MDTGTDLSEWFRKAGCPGRAMGSWDSEEEKPLARCALCSVITAWRLLVSCADALYYLARRRTGRGGRCPQNASVEVGRLSAAPAHSSRVGEPIGRHHVTPYRQTPATEADRILAQ